MAYNGIMPHHNVQYPPRRRVKEADLPPVDDKMLCCTKTNALWLLLTFSLVILGFQIRYQMRDKKSSYHLLVKSVVPDELIDVQPHLDRMKCANDIRIERVRKTCYKEKWNIDGIFRGNSVSRLGSLLVSDEHRVIYCYLPLVAGSEEFKALLMANSSVNEEDREVVQLSDLTVEEARDKLENYKKIILVQHPFSHLYSFYRSQVSLSEDVDSINKYFGNETIKGLSFIQFLELSVERGVLSGPKAGNDYYTMCMPCNIDYDRIMKYESIELDSKPVLEDFFGSKSSVPVQYEQENVVTSRKRVEIIGGDTSEKLVSDLLSKYERDLKLFGYGWNEEDGYVCGDRYGCANDAMCI